MCGIAGFTCLKHRPDRALAHRITRALHHRGPDQQGIFEGVQATLCAVRLKIIDLTGGDQPLASEDGGTVIAFNGEIYNHREIRQQLIACGHRFGSRRARQMGHLPQSGPGGMLEVLAALPAERKILIHINNTNPVLDEDGPEHARIRDAGIELAYDGMEFGV